MKAPGIAKVLNADPSADASLFGVYRLGDAERPLTPPPPLSGTLNFGDLEPYRYASTTRRRKKAKGRRSKATPVPVVEQDSSVETDVSEPVTPMSDMWPSHPVSPPADPEASHHSRSLTAYEDLESQDIPPATDASDTSTGMMNNQFGRSEGLLGGGHIVDSGLAYPERYEQCVPAAGFPATHTAQPTAGPSTYAMHGQAQEGYSTTHTGSRVIAPQLPVLRSQGGRRTTAPSNLSMSNPHRPLTRRYEPYARRLSQTALRNQVVVQGASTVPTHSMGPHWGVPPEVGPVVQNFTHAMSPGGEDFTYSPQATAYYDTSQSNVIFNEPETTPIWSESRWSAPPPDTSAISHFSATTYGEWSPTGEDLQAHQDTTDYAYYNCGLSTSRRM